MFMELYGMVCVRRRENAISNLGHPVHRVALEIFVFRSSAFSGSTYSSTLHTHLGFDTSYAQMTIAHLVIVCMESICTNTLILVREFIFVKISSF